MNLSHFSHEISSDPLDRIPAAMKLILDDPKVFFDIHCHVFNYKDVPNGFIGMRLPMTRRFIGKIENMLHNLRRNTDEDKFSRFAYFLHLLKTRTSADLAKQLVDYYPRRKAILTPLLMDMETGIKGKIERSYLQQIKDITELRDSQPDRLLPFLFIDPNRPDAKSIFLKAFSENHKWQFFGVKLYPSLGYLPSHPVLMEILDICEKKNIPVTAHCGDARVHNSRKRLKNIQGLRPTTNGTWKPYNKSRWFLTKNAYSKFFNDPRNWEPVLTKYPRLKLNLAHFGGGDDWEKYLEGDPNNRVLYLIDMMSRYRYLFTDFSYTFYKQDFNLKLRFLIEHNQLIADRVMYGSDFYMVSIQGKFRNLLANFITTMGDNIMQKIGVENARRFLLERTDQPIEMKTTQPLLARSVPAFFG